MDDFAAGLGVPFCDLGHILGDQIHVLHGQHRQFKARHPAHFARPKPTGIDDMFGNHRPLICHDIPGLVRVLRQILDHAMLMDFRTQLAGRLGIGMGDARGIKVAIHDRAHRTHETVRVDQRHDVFGLAGRDQLAFDTQIPIFGHDGFHPVQPLLRGGQHHTACQMHTGRLPRHLFDLLIQFDRILLQLGHVRVAIDRVHPAGRVPRRARGQLFALQQHHIGPAFARKMIQHRTADNAATNNHNFGMRFHRDRPYSSRPRALSCACNWRARVSPRSNAKT